MRSLLIRSLVIVVLCLSAVAPAFASPSLTVGLSAGKGRVAVVSPGETYAQTVTVSAGADEATDVLVEVLGYTENAKDGVLPLAPYDDASRYSARTFIQPARSVVRVEPGTTKRVELAVSIPADVGDGGRYAALRFSTAPAGQGSVGIVSAVVLTFKFTVSGSQLVHTGKIIDAQAGKVTSGQPLSFSAIFANTGNHHYSIRGQVNVLNARGQVVGTVPVSESSPLPEGRKQLRAVVTPAADLAPGEYSAAWALTLEDGALLAEAVAQFEVPTIYSAPTPSSSATPVAQTPQPVSTGPTPSVVTNGLSRSPRTNWIAIAGGAVGAVVLALGMYLFGVRRGRGR
jgi:hypothetical protein